MTKSKPKTTNAFNIDGPSTFAKDSRFNGANEKRGRNKPSLLVEKHHNPHESIVVRKVVYSFTEK